MCVCVSVCVCVYKVAMSTFVFMAQRNVELSGEL